MARTNHVRYRFDDIVSFPLIVASNCGTNGILCHLISLYHQKSENDISVNPSSRGPTASLQLLGMRLAVTAASRTYLLWWSPGVEVRLKNLLRKAL